MQELCIENLKDNISLLRLLDETAYRRPLNTLSGSSIGQHIRHIIELYQCLFDGLEASEVNYDNRKRNSLLENCPLAASEAMLKLLGLLEQNLQDKSIVLNGNFSEQELDALKVQSSFYRELVYNLEHSIHHQAMIKCGLIELGSADLAPKHFGIAPSTRRFHAETHKNKQSAHAG